MGSRVNPYTIGCVWTGEFDLNTLRVDGEIFESGKKKMRIQKYPDTCGRGLRNGVLCARDSQVSVQMAQHRRHLRSETELGYLSAGLFPSSALQRGKDIEDET